MQVRTLGAGDALWVARAKGSHGSSPDYVLDTLIERKNCSDLSSVRSRHGCCFPTGACLCSSAAAHLEPAMLLRG